MSEPSPITIQRRKDRDRHWGMPVPEHLKHGSGTRAARIYGCDCKTCLPTGRRWRKTNEKPTPTHRDRQKKLREAKKGQPVPPDVKHGVYAYSVYGHRCDICRAAAAATFARRQNRWRETATGHWDDAGEMTVLHWPPRGVGMWECPDCEQKFPHRAPKEAS